MSPSCDQQSSKCQTTKLAIFFWERTITPWVIRILSRLVLRPICLLLTSGENQHSFTDSGIPRQVVDEPVFTASSNKVAIIELGYLMSFIFSKQNLDPTGLSIERKVKQMWYKISETFTKNVILVVWSPLLNRNSIWSQNVTTIQVEKKVSNNFDRNRSANPSQLNSKRVAWLAVGFARE